MASLTEILSIRSEVDFKKSVSEFESTIEITFKPLTDKLRQQILTSEVQQLEMHMTFVESWRERASKALCIATGFENHGKSHHFLLSGGKGITATDRDSYQRSITAGANALTVYFEQLLKSIDSRVNLCKKLLYNEQEGNKSSKWV